jgi:putative RNA 2'-phosphotransferase
MSKKLESLSKFISLVLRHKPETINLHLDPEGWADIDDLVALSTSNGTELTREIVLEIVATSDKKRFSVDVEGKRIRANQGHSIEVDLKLTPQVPPSVLYHGTASRFLAPILQQGLIPNGRQHVHLSAAEATAIEVGKRHGKPVVLIVNTAEMVNQGHQFYLSDNGVWLTDSVPPKFLTQQLLV